MGYIVWNSKIISKNILCWRKKQKNLTKPIKSIWSKVFKRKRDLRCFKKSELAVIFSIGILIVPLGCLEEGHPALPLTKSSTLSQLQVVLWEPEPLLTLCKHAG